MRQSGNNGRPVADDPSSDLSRASKPSSANRWLRAAEAEVAFEITAGVRPGIGARCLFRTRCPSVCDLIQASSGGTTISKNEEAAGKAAGEDQCRIRCAVPGAVGPFAGMDVPWLLRMRSEARRDHPFLIWAPFDAPARSWAYGEFHARVGALAAGLAARGVRPGEFVLIHLDNCIEAMLAWFACVELGAIAVTTNTRSAPAELEYFAGPLRRDCRDHPAGLCRDRRQALPKLALAGGDFA